AALTPYRVTQRTCHSSFPVRRVTAVKALPELTSAYQASPRRISSGVEYPASSLAEVHSTLPVSFSRAMPALPTLSTSRLSWIIGDPANPHPGGGISASFLRFFDHTTRPVAAAKQNTSPARLSV